ncbi:hypothetical protein FNO01nite_00860 [Flavobacterium noncentrifugens]|uniref:Uncharacterized protein n=1 Tax=Flavobacterium noncentrifugens TaxID=1128970 RepID=A0A1G8RFN7_9FLAO|nr:hypothetical protein [Flavobacterium noncentrifugens]GEP49414.1 hypothetical protein FNO01nite_00860 [Flavobacterium noncentrifugens]SDJ15719.1 hypothetical protein SAMN04487935_0100 [Flavobacterium noncentrifugens]
METRKKFESRFEKASPKSSEEIKAACERIMSYDQQDYDIRSNGNHIWVEVGENKQQYWSPVLHLKIEKSEAENHTFIKGQFAESPVLWLVFLAAKFISVGIFIVSLVIAYYKYASGWNFNTELFLMFGMVSVWFALFLISENYKRKGAGQIKKLYDFVDAIAA